jgi:hypothetical protein
VPRRTGEIGTARDVRNGRSAELAYGGDNGGCLKRVAVIELQLPHRPALIELGRGDARPEAQAWAEPALRDQRVQVGQDLFPGREPPAPARGPERERVQVRRDVAGKAWICVIPPDPPEFVSLVDDEEVLDARLLKGRGHADPPEPGADDDHAVGRMLGHGLSLACARPGLRTCPGAGSGHEPGIGSITKR